MITLGRNTQLTTRAAASSAGPVSTALALPGGVTCPRLERRPPRRRRRPPHTPERSRALRPLPVCEIAMSTHPPAKGGRYRAAREGGQGLDIGQASPPGHPHGPGRTGTRARAPDTAAGAGVADGRGEPGRTARARCPTAGPCAVRRVRSIRRLEGRSGGLGAPGARPAWSGSHECLQAGIASRRQSDEAGTRPCRRLRPNQRQIYQRTRPRSIRPCSARVAPPPSRRSPSRPSSNDGPSRKRAPRR